VVPGVLDAAACAHVLDRLWAAAGEYRRRGHDTHMPALDPNSANVRVFDLLDMDQVFRDLIRRPLALDLVRAAIGPHFRISNFTANIARPGSGSMALHSDSHTIGASSRVV